MDHYLLRIEAFNFANFIFDTSDLSTVRGGSLLMLDAPNTLAAPGGVKEWKKIYSGASTALFEFCLDAHENAEAVRTEIEAKLHQGALQEATIMVDVQPWLNADDFQKTITALTSRNRIRQLQTPSFIYPDIDGAAGSDELDDKRPGYERQDMRRPVEAGQPVGQPMVLSDATYNRRKYGQTEKRNFYIRVKYEIDEWRDFPFHEGEYVNDFEQLSSYSDAKPSDLNGKIAYIYLDGNKFGSVARSCRDPDTLRRWSDTVQANQDSFLNWLMRVKTEHAPQTGWHWSGRTISNTGQEINKSNAFRIETPLWGGDEISWVVPAWCGWWVLASFFDCYGKLPWKDGSSSRTNFKANGSSVHLSHGAAIVFCHAEAPIRRIERLAKQLAEQPKRLGTANRSDNEYADYFVYQVLESFDHLGTDADKVRATHLPLELRALTSSPLILSGRGMLEIVEQMDVFRERFPRSKLHSLTRAIIAGEPDCVEQAEQELGRAGVQDEFQKLRVFFGAQATAPKDKEQVTWLHISELWDYTHKPVWTAPPVI